eukprot:6542286-Alexandrium_andersonii.AAC.1
MHPHDIEICAFVSPHSELAAEPSELASTALACVSGRGGFRKEHASMGLAVVARWQPNVFTQRQWSLRADRTDGRVRACTLA